MLTQEVAAFASTMGKTHVIEGEEEVDMAKMKPREKSTYGVLQAATEQEEPLGSRLVFAQFMKRRVSQGDKD
eukprot:4857099-Lingulodinium_polyedra.AAC.1